MTSTQPSPRELADEVVVPAGRRVQLESAAAGRRRAAPEREQARRVADPDRCHEPPTGSARPGRRRPGSERPFWRRARSSAALSNAHLRYLAGAVADRGDRGMVGQAEQPRELVERAGPVQPGELVPASEELDLVDLVPRDVLALAGVRSRRRSRTTIETLVNPPDVSRTSGRSSQPSIDERQPGDVCVGRAGLSRQLRREPTPGRKTDQDRSAGGRPGPSMLRMEVLRPGSEAYEAARRPGAGGFADARPAAIARCASAADVAEALALARGRPLAVRSGGHCFAGRSSTDGRADRRRADGRRGDRRRDGAGRRRRAARRIYDALDARGGAIAGGCGPEVGIAGLLLGGGLGVLGRMHGLTCDQLSRRRSCLRTGASSRPTRSRARPVLGAARGRAAVSSGS